MRRIHRLLLPLALAVVSITGCGGDGGDDSPAVSTDSILAQMLDASGMAPMPEPEVDEAQVALGQALFFDKELSGNRNISCSTCHTPEAVTADAISLSIGEGGVGRAQNRVPVYDAYGQPILIARHSPTLFLRGALKTMFWDGRVQENEDGSFTSPAGDDLLPGLENPLAVVEMFPFTDRAEMRGQPGENELADIPDDDLRGIWAALMDRLLAIPGYVEMFATAYPDVPVEALDFSHAANAIAAFEIKHWTLLDSPFDRYLRGDKSALSDAQKQGAMLFFGKANCTACHSGPLMTDESFHNRIVPQIGPGKGGGPEGLHDFGHEMVSGDPADRFTFKTPPLRNVAASGPFMHDGAFSTLENAVRHCMDPITSALNYDPNQLMAIYRDSYHPEQTPEIIARADPGETLPIVLSGEEVALLIEFLHALDSDSLDNLPILDTPDSVPSGLPLED